MERVWHLHTAEGSQGPYAAEEITAWVAEGRITSEWSVWREGDAGWRRIADVPEFAAPPAPAPPPPAPPKVPARPAPKPQTIRLDDLNAPRGGSKNAELLEWIGLAPADLAVYVATAALGGMYYWKDPVVDHVLAGVAVLFCLVACAVGMRRKENLSGFTNTVKMISYPLCLLIAVGLIVRNYSHWNR